MGSFLNTANSVSADEFIEEADFFDDVQTVVSATRLKQKISEAPVSVTIIDREMIEASGATEVYDLFRLVPGFFSYSLQGNQFSVINHYYPNEVSPRLEVQINGRSVYDPLFSAVNWTSLGLDIGDIDYIEVIRGSSAAAYGSNAFLGAINIITKDILSRPKGTIRAEIGNIGRKNITLNHNGHVKDLNYGFSFVHRSDTGFEPLDDTSIPGFTKHDDRKSTNLTFEGSYTPDLNNELKFSIGFGESNTEIFSNSDPRGHASRQDNVQHQKLNWKHKNNNIENSIQFTHDHLRSDVDEVFFPLSLLVGASSEQIPSIFPGQQDQLLVRDDKPGLAERYDLEFVHKNTAQKNVNYVVGLGARKDSVESGFYFGDGEKTDERYRVFGNADWRFHDKANLNIGLLVEKTKESGTVSSPRVALNWHPVKNHTLRASVTKPQLAGSLSFINLETRIRLNDGTPIDVLTQASETIGTEHLTAYELAYIAKFPKIKTQFDLKLFREEMRDFGVTQKQPFPDLDGQRLVLDNLLDLNTKGLELQLTHQFDRIPDFTARLSYAYFDSDGSYQGDISIPNSLIDIGSYIPKHSGTLLLNKKLPNAYSISSLIQYQSDTVGLDRQVKRVDFRLGKKLKFASFKGKVDFVIQNAFGEFNDFATRNSKNVFDRRGFIRFEADF